MAETQAFFGGAVYVDGKYYACDYDYDYDNDGDLLYVNWYVYDALTWHQEKSVECPLNYSYIATDRTYDETTSTVYSISYNAAGTAIWLSTTNLTNGRPTLIAPLEKDVIMIAASPKGVLYGLDTEGNLYTIGKEDAKLTLIGSTNAYENYISEYPQSLTFDKKTGKLYWVEFHIEGMFTGASALFEIDPNTASTVKIADLPNGAEFIGAYISEYQQAGVPSAADEIVATPQSAGSLVYNISYKVPTKTVDGKTLENKKMSVEVAIDDVMIDIREALPGETVSCGPFTMQQGLRTLKITTTNEVGSGEVAAKMFFAGYDVPAAPQNVHLNVAGNTATVSWTAVTEGAEGGVLRLPVKYNVMRMPDEEIVAEGIEETSIVDEITNPARVYYIVTGFTDEGEGLSAQSNNEVMGALELPYSTSFASQAEFDLYTIVDVTSGGKVWNYDKENQRLRHPWSMDYEIDDYAISPALNMDADKSYEVTFDAYQMVASYNEHVMLYFGSSPNPEAMTLVLDTEKLPTEPKTFTAKVAPQHDGPHYIAFRSKTGKNGFMSYVDDVRVVANGTSAIPASVTDMKAEPAANGELAINVSCVAPSTLLSGKPLETITRVEILRGEGNEPIKVFDAPQPSQLLKWTDTSVQQGLYTYRARVYAYDAVSEEVSAVAYAGIDVPMAVQNIVCTETAEGRVITWDAPLKGVNGGNLEGLLTYRVSRVVNDDSEVISEGQKELSYIDSWTSTSQAFVYYTVEALTSAGASEGVNTKSFAVGEAYAIPFAESFAGAKAQMVPWSVEQVLGLEGSWTIVESGENPYAAAQDKDGGLALFDGYHSWASGCELRLVSPRIVINNYEDATLTYYVYHENGYNQWTDETSPVEETMSVEISVDGKAFEVIPNSEIELYAAQSGWQKHVVFLGDYKQSESVRIAFRGKSAGCYNILLDNIEITATKPWSGISDVNATMPNVKGGKGEIVFENVEGGISVFNIAGVKIASQTTDNGRVKVAPGVYVVITNEGCNYKLTVR